MLTRAYSLLTLKAVDEEQRTITGTATTPAPDRVGDIIEPLGVTFKNPLPLLLYHDQRAPVGTVKMDRPTKDGVTFTAQLATVTEPGRLKDRVDEAWQSIKAKLIRGVSVGFRAVDKAVDWMEDTGGLRYRKTEILELSLVAVPANAEATIDNIKHFAVPAPAAPGQLAHSAPTRPGASGDARKSAAMNLSERLTAKKAELKTKSARLEELVTKRMGDTALSDAEQTEARDLAVEVKDITAEIEQLDVLEAAMAKAAAKVVRTSEPAPQATEGVKTTHVEVKDNRPVGISFARAVICKMAAFLSQGSMSALDIARARYANDAGVQALIKAAVNPMATNEGAGVGGNDLVYAQNLVSEFVEWLRPQTIVGKFGTGDIPSLRRVPFNVRIGGQTSGAAGYWVGQAQPKPLTRFNTGVNQTLGWCKSAAIAVISDDLARFSSPSAETLVRDELGKAIRERLDRDFVDPTVAVAAGVHPASITNAIGALTPSGTDAAAVRADLAQLLQPFITASIDPTAIVLVTTNTVALALSLMRNALGQKEFPDITMKGGVLEGFPVIASQYCNSGSPASDLLIAASASDIFLADDGGVSVDMSREASLEMSDDPANEAGTVVSMFQNNLIALRAERYINWALRRAAAVQYLSGVAYSSGSPS